MGNRVVRILPALVREAFLAHAVIFDEIVAVGVGRPIDPAERRLDRRPQFLQRGEVAGAVEIKSRERDEQRRCVDAAVVALERDLAQRRHLAAAHLVHDLAGLRVVRRVDDGGLGRGKPAQHAARHARIEPQHFDRGDDAVAAERRRIPGDAGVGIRPLRRLGYQHVKIGHRAAQHFVEHVVRRGDGGGVARGALALMLRLEHRLEEARRSRRLAARALDAEKNRNPLLGGKRELIFGGRLREPGRRRLEPQGGRARRAVEPGVTQRHRVGCGNPRRHRSAACAG